MEIDGSIYTSIDTYDIYYLKVTIMSHVYFPVIKHCSGVIKDVIQSLYCQIIEHFFLIPCALIIITRASIVYANNNFIVGASGSFAMKHFFHILFLLNCVGMEVILNLSSNNLYILVLNIRYLHLFFIRPTGYPTEY